MNLFEKIAEKQESYGDKVLNASRTAGNVTGVLGAGAGAGLGYLGGKGLGAIIGSITDGLTPNLTDADREQTRKRINSAARKTGLKVGLVGGLLGYALGRGAGEAYGSVKYNYLKKKKGLEKKASDKTRQQAYAEAKSRDLEDLYSKVINGSEMPNVAAQAGRRFGYNAEDKRKMIEEAYAQGYGSQLGQRTGIGMGVLGAALGGAAGHKGGAKQALIGAGIGGLAAGGLGYLAGKGTGKAAGRKAGRDLYDIGALGNGHRKALRREKEQKLQKELSRQQAEALLAAGYLSGNGINSKNN